MGQGKERSDRGTEKSSVGQANEGLDRGVKKSNVSQAKGESKKSQGNRGSTMGRSL